MPDVDVLFNRSTCSFAHSSISFPTNFQLHSWIFTDYEKKNHRFFHPLEHHIRNLLTNHTKLKILQLLSSRRFRTKSIVVFTLKRQLDNIAYDGSVKSFKCASIKNFDSMNFHSVELFPLFRCFTISSRHLVNVKDWNWL